VESDPAPFSSDLTISLSAGCNRPTGPARYRPVAGRRRLVVWEQELASIAAEFLDSDQAATDDL